MKCRKKQCKNKMHSRGLCQKHYWHFAKNNPKKIKKYEKHENKDMPTYIVWKQMKARCLSKGATSYARYGARGITVCEDWKKSFNAFYDHVGKKPIGMQLDRIDNSKGYCPGNCRWVTPLENVQNSRIVKLNKESVKDIRLSGLSINELSAKYKVCTDTIRNAKIGKTWRNV